MREYALNHAISLGEYSEYGQISLLNASSGTGRPVAASLGWRIVMRACCAQLVSHTNKCAGPWHCR